MSTTQELGATSASAATQDFDANATRSLGSTGGGGLADTKLLETTAREGMSLIDRFCACFIIQQLHTTHTHF